MAKVKEKIGFIGGGNMGSAIIGGIHRLYAVHVCESDAKRASMLKRKYTVKVGALAEVVKSTKVIVLAVKPQSFESVLKALKPYVTKNHIVVTIAAGITCRYIEQRLGTAVRVVRTMPNLPAQIQQGVTGLCPGHNTRANDVRMVKKIFDLIGTTVVVDERRMDAITAASGSGPAYVFLFAECFAKAAKSVGLDQDLCDDIVLQTLKGSVALLESQKEAAAVLRKRVTSKGGTTQAALEVFDQNKFDKTFNQALKAARKRAKELSR